MLEEVREDHVLPVAAVGDQPEVREGPLGGAHLGDGEGGKSAHPPATIQHPPVTLAPHSWKMDSTLNGRWSEDGSAVELNLPYIPE